MANYGNHRLTEIIIKPRRTHIWGGWGFGGGGDDRGESCSPDSWGEQVERGVEGLKPTQVIS